MYKGASRALQHAHRVDQIDPSKGFVWRDSEMDLLPNAGNMSLAMCRDELRQTAIELGKLDNALAVAKRQKDKEQVEFLGQQYAGLCNRRAPIKIRMHELMADNDQRLFADAINANCEEELAAKIFGDVRAARKALLQAAFDNDF